MSKRIGKRRSRRRHRSHVSKDNGYYTKAGPVTIYKPDGEIEQRPALTEREYHKQVRERIPIPEHIRAKIHRRDKKCRYCGTDTGPFEIDHRIPVALGGTNRYGNLVLACAECNRKKGARLW